MTFHVTVSHSTARVVNAILEFLLPSFIYPDQAECVENGKFCNRKAFFIFSLEMLSLIQLDIHTKCLPFSAWLEGRTFYTTCQIKFHAKRVYSGKMNSVKWKNDSNS